MKVSKEVREFLSKIGSIRTKKKAISSAANGRLGGKLGGRPRQFPKCPRYRAHRFSPTTGKCPCGFARPE